MRLRILQVRLSRCDGLCLFNHNGWQLENELRAVKKQKTTASTQQTTLNAFTGQAGPSTASQPVVDAKAIKTRKKNLFDAYALSSFHRQFNLYACCRIKKAAKGEKYQNKTITLKVEEHFNQTDFESVFGSSGVLIQPTATNKVRSLPSSVVESCFSSHTQSTAQVERMDPALQLAV